jgi:glycosyltransferase involved in cell wall biosynthesis
LTADPPIGRASAGSIYLNGKFTAQRTTGVQRVAARLIQALDAQLTTGDASDWVLLCPPGSEAPPLRHIAVRRIGPRGLPLHLWEQAVLPLAARRGLLVNLAGAAPYFAARQVCLLHDAAVFDCPQAYTRTFVAWYRLLFRRLARSAARLLTVSAFSQARLTLHLQLAPARIGVLRNGCEHLDDIVADDSMLARHGLADTRFLLAVGSANPSKNLAALVAAYAQLPADAARRLVIAGGGNERVFATGEAPDPPGVVRTGAAGDAQLAALYRHATALIFPSLYEGFGLIPLEAMRCGCPVAAARAAAIPEVCGDAVLYFDPHSVPAIAEAMQRLLSDAALREQLRCAGEQHARGFCWSDAAAVLRAEVQRLNAKANANANTRAA